MDATGRIDPVLRSVVLAAVRGEGTVLRVDSPFTTSLERVLAELIHAKSYLRAHFPEEAEQLLQSDPLGRLLKHLPKPQGWREREQRTDEPPSALPPH